MKEGTWFTRVTSDHFVGLLEGEDADDVKDAYLALTREFGAEMNRRYDQSSLTTFFDFKETLGCSQALNSPLSNAAAIFASIAFSASFFSFYGYTEGDKILKAFATYLRGMKEGTWFTRVTSDHFVGLLALSYIFCR